MSDPAEAPNHWPASGTGFKPIFSHHLEGQVLAPPLEGWPPNQHLVNDASKSPEVGRVGQGLVVEDLGTRGRGWSVGPRDKGRTGDDLE